MLALQLFMIDEPAASTSKILDQPTRSEDTLSEQDDEDADDDEAEGTDNEDVEALQDDVASPYSSLKGKEPAKKKSLWTDEADENISVSLQGTKRFRKLRTEAAEDVVSGADYERRLRLQ